MFLVVWVLYAVDRLLDTRNHRTTLQPRHHFHRRHKRLFATAIVLSLVALVPLVIAFPRALLAPYAELGTLLVLWLAVIHTMRRTRPLPSLKEAAAGLFFAAAIFLPSARPPTPALLMPFVLFALLGILNGLFITTWEAEGIKPQAAAPAMTPAMFLAAASLALASLALAGLAAAFSILAPGTASPIPHAIAIAAVFLFLLDRFRQHLAPTTARAAADAALLTPIFFLWHP